MSFLLIIDITFSCIFLSVPSTEVVLIDEALPSEREATYFTLRVFFFISLLRVPGSICIAITNKVGGDATYLPPILLPVQQLTNQITTSNQVI